MDVKNFGLYLRRLREEKGLTLTKLGELTDYSNPYLSQIETGKRKNIPPPEFLKKLAKPLGVEYSELLHAAGYEDLYQGVRHREAIRDFSSDEDLMDLLERVSLLEQTKDIKNFLELNIKGVNNEEIRPFYNGHLLTESDRRRIVNVLKELFPEYQEEGTDLTDG